MQALAMNFARSRAESKSWSWQRAGSSCVKKNVDTSPVPSSSASLKPPLLRVLETGYSNHHRHSDGGHNRLVSISGGITAKLSHPLGQQTGHLHRHAARMGSPSCSEIVFARRPPATVASGRLRRRMLSWIALPKRCRAGLRRRAWSAENRVLAGSERSIWPNLWI